MIAFNDKICAPLVVCGSRLVQYNPSRNATSLRSDVVALLDDDLAHRELDMFYSEYKVV